MTPAGGREDEIQVLDRLQQNRERMALVREQEDEIKITESLL